MFEELMDAAERGELILLPNAICHWHLRRDGQVTIREILVLPSSRGSGIGKLILEMLKEMNPKAKSIFAKCPVDLESNGWYKHMGFVLEGQEKTRTGRELNLWRLPLNKNQK